MRGAYEVQLANGFTVRAMLSGRMMRHKIRVTVGRNVRSWGEAEGADRQTPLNSVENDPQPTWATNFCCEAQRRSHSTMW
jgi:hypothetical protein